MDLDHGGPGCIAIDCSTSVSLWHELYQALLFHLCKLILTKEGIGSQTACQMELNVDSALKLV